MNRVLYILFFLLCGGSIFFHTHCVNDGQIVSKWLLAEAVACLWLLAFSLRHMPGTRNKRNNKQNLHQYFLAMLACCWAESVYGIFQALPLFHSANSLPVSYMCPVKFTPLYRCYTIYKELGMKEPADSLADKILNKKIKIPSSVIDHMRMEIIKDRDNQHNINQ